MAGYSKSHIQLSPFLCQSQANLRMEVLLLPFFCRNGYSRQTANTPLSPINPISDNVFELFVMKYIFYTVTSPREMHSNSAIALRILDFHAVKVSSLGKNTVVGIPTAVPFLVLV